MKNQALIALLAALIANVYCGVIEPVEVKELKGLGEPKESVDAIELVEPIDLIANNEEAAQDDDVDEPVQVIETFEEVDFGSETSPNVFSGIVQPRNGILFRGNYRRSAVSNTIHVHRVTYRGRASTRISSVRAAQIGSNQGATGRVVSGGTNRNFVTVELRSARGRGFNIQLEIWGRY